MPLGVFILWRGEAMTQFICLILFVSVGVDVCVNKCVGEKIRKCFKSEMRLIDLKALVRAKIPLKQRCRCT